MNNVKEALKLDDENFMLLTSIQSNIIYLAQIEDTKLLNYYIRQFKSQVRRLNYENILELINNFLVKGNVKIIKVLEYILGFDLEENKDIYDDFDKSIDKSREGILEELAILKDLKKYLNFCRHNMEYENLDQIFLFILCLRRIHDSDILDFDYQFNNYILALKGESIRLNNSDDKKDYNIIKEYVEEKKNKIKELTTLSRLVCKFL